MENSLHAIASAIYLPLLCGILLAMCSLKPCNSSANVADPAVASSLLCATTTLLSSFTVAFTSSCSCYKPFRYKEEERDGTTRMFLVENRMGSYWFFWVCLIFWLLALGGHLVDCELSGDYISWDDFNTHDSILGKMEGGNGEKNRVIMVAKNGKGDSTTVQGAVDLVPHGNDRRVKIFIQSGIYREKVLIPITKPFISFIGNESGETVISWNSTASEKGPDGQPIGTILSASVAIESDYFCGTGITFKNSAPSALPGTEGKQAVALRVSGDKAMFFRCKVVGSQDTLFDHMGRHYFYKCEIQGAIDFIFGSARSLYESCVLHATAASYGAIAASQRNSPNENSGFSFLQCKLDGTGMLYLGRAWGRYARVVYSLCDLGDIIIPEGWYDWGDPSRRRTVWFAEYNCRGGGADSRERVPWSKSLTYEEAKPFLTNDYIDGKQWLRL